VVKQKRGGRINREWPDEAVCDTNRETVCKREERARERQCGDMNKGSVVKAVLKEVRILLFNESVPQYRVRFGS
jgi:hypothetical protein